MTPSKGSVVTFHTDATIYRCDLEEGRKITFERTQGRRVFLYLTQGELSLDGRQIVANDQARIDADRSLLVEANQPAEFILIHVPSYKGWGYSDEALSGKKR